MSSPNTIIYTCDLKEKKIFDKEKSELEKIFSEILNIEVNLVFLEEDEWIKETNKYIENKKRGILPKYIDENDKIKSNKIEIFEKILEIE